MPEPRRHYTDPDRRMDEIVTALNPGTPDAPFRGWDDLDRSRVPGWVAELREAEANIRLLRKRLEALIAETPPDTCQRCGVPIYGKAGRKFCSNACRQAAHKARVRAAKEV